MQMASVIKMITVPTRHPVITMTQLIQHVRSMMNAACVAGQVSLLIIAIAMEIRTMLWVSVVALAWLMWMRTASAMTRITAPTRRPAITIPQPTKRAR